MTTLSDIINDVVLELHGQTQDLEQLTFLNGTITPSTTTIPVADASQLSSGLIEIDDELLWVTAVDQTNNVVTVPTAGRGFRDSTAASHTNGSIVTDNPRFPRSSIAGKVNEAISECYPEIFTVKTDESNTINPVQTTYAVPSDCDNILNVSVKSIGPTLYWEPVRKYDLNVTADPTLWPTGRTISVKGPLWPGQPLRLTYIARPSPFVLDTDTLTSIGLDDNFRDVLRYGACYRLVAGMEIARLQSSSVAQGYDRTTYVGTSGAATAGSKYYLGLFQQRLQNERNRLMQIHPTTAHMSR